MSASRGGPALSGARPASPWPLGGGSAGARLRAGNPPPSGLGAVEDWPAGLRSAVEICLSSGFPSFVFWGPGLVQLYNDPAAALLRSCHPSAFGQPLRGAWPEGEARLGPLLMRALESGEAVFQEDLALHTAGEESRAKRFALSCSPLRDPADGVAGLFCTLAEAAQGEQRLRSVLERMPLLVWRASAPGEWSWAGPQWSAFTGLSGEESLGQGWLAALHPEDREGAMEAWSRAPEAGRFEAEFRLRHAADGAHRWFQTRAVPLQGGGEGVAEWIGTSTEVDELRRMGQHQRLLMGELQHRVRNTLGVIRSIIHRTVQASDDLDDLAMHLEGRIDAFSRVQAAVTRNPTSGLDLAQLIADELLSFTAREGKQAWIDGPPVALKPKVAETFALAFHELATNAMKYGALSSPQGRVEVSWRVEHSGEIPRLHLTWRETGMRGGATPAPRRGFGTDLLERTLPYELQAQVERRFEADGLCCTISLPLTPRVLADTPPNPDPQA
ncbi:sensor histidine kinase [Muricoccus pecuniae]|uniref:histidine kinase n=1 Tax=Muricoccus pecuniae TaxID=693023 RepID=A0A840YFE9_9PROT|nr:HWE histidine kinase domain-containing protein [Roseomonas pecuniae]MBB5694951.1 PAS domain S-box-containing protein [Roseomonas pecuniae]